MRRKLILFLLLLSHRGLACSCINEFTEFTPYYLTQYNHIFTCKPFFSDTVLEYSVYYKVKVIDSYWGTNNDTMTITTSRSSAACGLKLDLNSEYIIYGNGESYGVSVNKCSPSGHVDVNFDLDEFKNQHEFSLTLNGIHKNYTFDELKNYIVKAQENELETLKKIAAIKNGELITLFTNNQKSGVLKFTNGKLNDVSIFYYPNGIIKAKGKLANNVMQGSWIENTMRQAKNQFFYIQWSGLYQSNERTGKWTGEMLQGSYKDYYDLFGEKLTIEY